MKKCAPPASYRFLSVFVVVACGAAAFLAFCQLFYGGQSPVVCAIMGLLFGSAALFLLRSMIFRSGWGFFYDDEKVIFVLSRKDRREYSWEQLKNADIAYPIQEGYFYFPDGEKIALHPRMEGYASFVAMLQRKGLKAARAPNFADVDPKDIFYQMFGEEFEKGGKTGKKK